MKRTLLWLLAGLTAGAPMMAGPTLTGADLSALAAWGGTRRVLAVTQQELALMIGVSRQTTNQILKELEAQGG